MSGLRGHDRVAGFEDVSAGADPAADSGHTGTVIAVAAHGDTMVSGGEDGTVRIWAPRQWWLIVSTGGYTSEQGFLACIEGPAVGDGES